MDGGSSGGYEGMRLCIKGDDDNSNMESMKEPRLGKEDRVTILPNMAQCVRLWRHGGASRIEWRE